MMPAPNSKSRYERRLIRDFITGGTGLLVPREGEDVGALAASAAASARDAWVAWLAPRFPQGAAYFTGTYSDDYGLPHGLMACGNVHRDFRRFLVERGLTDREFINGVEQHQYRDVLHCHAIISGDFTEVERRILQAEWERERGFARVLPVLDGCASYVTKYALKGSAEHFDWNIS